MFIVCGNRFVYNHSDFSKGAFYMVSFSQRLSFLREQADITQAEVARNIHVDKQTISQYERGVRRPNFDLLEKLCDFFNVSSDYLLGLSDVTVKLSEAGSFNSSLKFIPVFGSVSAGIPNEAIDTVEGYIEIPNNWQGEYGALRVHGDSMMPTIREGDIVIYKKQESAESGDIVIAMTDGTDTTIKKLIRRGKALILQPFNEAYKPMVFEGKNEENLKILGRVVENRQRF